MQYGPGLVLGVCILDINISTNTVVCQGKRSLFTLMRARAIATTGSSMYTGFREPIGRKYHDPYMAIRDTTRSNSLYSQLIVRASVI
jgi:hypothetical protein